MRGANAGLPLGADVIRGRTVPVAAKESVEKTRVGARIQKLLAEKEKSADKLALELGMSTGFIYEFLNGKKGITLETLDRISEGLEVDAKDLF